MGVEQTLCNLEEADGRIHRGIELEFASINNGNGNAREYTAPPVRVEGVELTAVGKLSYGQE